MSEAVDWMDHESALQDVARELRAKANALLASEGAMRVALVRCASALAWCAESWTAPAVDRGAGLPMIRAALASAREALDTVKENNR